VTVYTDHASSYLAHQLELRDAVEKDAEVHEELVAEITRLKEKVLLSAQTYRLRGIGTGTKKAIRTETALKFPQEYDALGQPVPETGPDFGPGADWSNAKTVAEHIVSVTNIDGEVFEHHWTPEEVIELKENLPPESWQEIENLVMKLSFASAYFDASVTPDFS
jgi:hypothetical protein